MQKFTSPRSEVVKALVATGNWSEVQATLGEQTGYCCDYCGLDFLASVTHYKLWVREHIVPVVHHNDTDYDLPSNLTIACSVCNSFKATYDPRSAFPQGNPTRSQLIEAARIYINQKRAKILNDMEEVKKIAGYVS